MLHRQESDGVLRVDRERPALVVEQDIEPLEHIPPEEPRPEALGSLREEGRARKHHAKVAALPHQVGVALAEELVEVGVACAL